MMHPNDPTRWQLRLENFTKAMAQLDSACGQASYTDLERAGLVQTFAFSFELAWKTLKDLLIYEGYEATSPREVIRQSFEAGLLDEAATQTLLDALNKRNLPTHTYEQSTAMEAERLIKEQYTPVLQQLLTTLNDRPSQ